MVPFVVMRAVSAFNHKLQKSKCNKVINYLSCFQYMNGEKKELFCNWV